MRWWLERADGLVDVRAVTRLWKECLEGAADDVKPALLHGDLIPGNLLLADAHLTAVIDWGGLGAGDPAQDVDPAWSVLDAAGAAAFREALDVDEPSWLRARGFTLEHAAGESSAPRRVVTRWATSCSAPWLDSSRGGNPTPRRERRPAVRRLGGPGFVRRRVWLG